MGALCSCCIRPSPTNDPSTPPQESPLGSPAFFLARAAPGPFPTSPASYQAHDGDRSATPTPTPTSTRRPPLPYPVVTGAGPRRLRLSFPWVRGTEPRTPSAPATPPCIRITHLSWTAPANLTDLRALNDHRDAFWDTAPTYGGRSEIWMALRMAVNAVRDGDAELAKVIADAAQLTLPTSGDITCDPAYDPLGNAYTVPVYCLVDPSNLGALPAPPISIAIPMSLDSSQDTVATSPTAPLLDSSGPVTLDATTVFSEESLGEGAHSHVRVSTDPPPPLFATDAMTPSSSSSIIKSTQVRPPHRSLDLIVRLSSGPSVPLPTANNNWTVSDTISAVMSLDQSGPFKPKAMMYLGRLLSPSLKLGEVQRITPEGPLVLQLLVVPTGDEQVEVDGEGRGPDDPARESRTPVAGRQKP